MNESSGTPLMTVQDVAQFLNVSTKTIYYWVGRNEVPHLKVGRHLRFDCQAVVDFFGEQTRAKKVESRRAILGSDDLRSLKTRNTRIRNFTPPEKE